MRIVLVIDVRINSKYRQTIPRFRQSRNLRKDYKKNGISRSFALGFVSRVERYESLVCWKRESESREKLEEERIASRRKEKRRKETKRRTERN